MKLPVRFVLAFFITGYVIRAKPTIAEAHPGGGGGRPSKGFDMSETMRYIGKRALVTGVSLEPGQIYTIDPLERKFGRDGFWVEVSDGQGKCRCPYESSESFLQNWEVIKPGA